MMPANTRHTHPHYRAYVDARFAPRTWSEPDRVERGTNARIADDHATAVVAALVLAASRRPVSAPSHDRLTGLPAAQLKQFIDQTRPLWRRRRLANRVSASSFTGSENRNETNAMTRDGFTSV